MSDPWESDPVAKLPVGPIVFPGDTFYQRDARLSDNAIGEKAVFMQILKPRKLSTRDKNLASGVFLSTDELLADERDALTPSSMNELAKEIATNPNKKAQKILQAEQAKLMPQYLKIIGSK